MKFSNTTRHAAEMLKNISPRDDRMMGCVIARVLHDVALDGSLRPAAQPWPVGVEPIETPLGPKPGDKPFYLGGIDVLLGGRVFQPDRAMRGRLDVELTVGRTFRRRIAVFGERRWVRGPDGALVPGPPEAFGSMRLDYALAYGGSAIAPDGSPTMHGPNPLGRGYYHDERAAEGQPLPNLEDPNQLVQSFRDRPAPVGLGYYPEDGSLRPMSAIDHPLVTEGDSAESAAEPFTAANLRPTMFNQGHPGMIIEALKTPLPGDVVRLTNGRRSGEDLWFTLPEPAFHLHVQLEERERVIPLHLDQIGIIAGDARVLLSYRVVFEYRLNAAERRFATLHEGPVPEEIPASYRQNIHDEWDEKWWDDERVVG